MVKRGLSINIGRDKYKKVSFSNPGHAFNLAQRLNNMFDSQDFSVVMLTEGKVVTEDEVKAFKDQ